MINLKTVKQDNQSSSGDIVNDARLGKAPGESIGDVIRLVETGSSIGRAKAADIRREIGRETLRALRGKTALERQEARRKVSLLQSQLVDELSRELGADPIPARRR